MSHFQLIQSDPPISPFLPFSFFTVPYFFFLCPTFSLSLIAPCTPNYMSLLSPPQVIAQITNDLAPLIPVGTLLFHSTPNTTRAFHAIELSRTWRWLDADFLFSAAGTNLGEVLASLVFLVRRRYFAATVCPFRVPVRRFRAHILVWKVRLYAVPLDIDRSRYIRHWRNDHVRSANTKKFKDAWLLLLPYVDFSRRSWRSLRFCAAPCLPTYKSGRKLALAPAAHIERWLRLAAFNTLLPKHILLDQLVKAVYASIKTPTLSGYQEAPHSAEHVPSPPEAIADLLANYHLGSQIKGLETRLYPFQLRSVCKMYEKETLSVRAPVPHFVKISPPQGRPYYYDTLGTGFYNMPETFLLPRGGILAENMGLGKTLICIALICLTKHEISTPPPDSLFSFETPRLTLKPLSELASESVTKNSLPWKFYEDILPESAVKRLNEKPCCVKLLHFLEKVHKLRHQSSASTSTKQSLLLASSTLVVVPENVLHQWDDEMKKHVARDALKRLFVSERFKKSFHEPTADYVNRLPADARDLLLYDVVIMTALLFSRLCLDHDSPLLLVFWKRLIIDEGHSMNSRASNLSASSQAIYAERRWAVTGTPTSGLTNLHVDEDSQDDILASPKKKRKYVVKSTFNERDDLNKIGNLVARYFGLEPFKSQPGLWTSSVVQNLVGANQLMARESLQNLLDALMVRHSQAQIEADLNLPQMHHEAVFLEPSYHNKLAMNLFTAVLAVNAVSSERVGPDFMFDATNRPQLRRLVTNLQLSTFYWTGFQFSDVETLKGIIDHCLRRTNPDGSSKYSSGDLELLRRSLVEANRALENARWKAAAMLHEMQIFVRDLPSIYTSYFGTGSFGDVGVFGGPHLAAVQTFYYKNRFMTQDDPTQSERFQQSSAEFWTSYWANLKSKGALKRQEEISQGDLQSLKEEAGDVQILSTHSALLDQKNDQKRANLNAKPMLFDRPQTNTCKNIDAKEAEILGTASAKLSYLATKLVTHQRDGIKSIVFFEFEDSAYYLTELLAILGVNHILYATFVGPEQRANNLNEFAAHRSADLGGLTLVMDLKLAAHGLTIISATRVYFINPVWQRSVEAQAIKRAHRIGQTEEVFVETLVLRGTLEEEIYRKRHLSNDQDDLSDGDSNKKYVIDDSGMQEFILRFAFLPVGNEKEYADFQDVRAGDFERRNDSESASTEFSLPTHTSNLQSGLRKWKMRLFSQDNLQHTNNSKRDKPNLDQLNSDFVKGQVIPVSLPQKPRKQKSVRF